jgi:hypothetical protein
VRSWPQPPVCRSISLSLAPPLSVSLGGWLRWRRTSATMCGASWRAPSPRPAGSGRPVGRARTPPMPTCRCGARGRLSLLSAQPPTPHAPHDTHHGFLPPHPHPIPDRCPYASLRVHACVYVCVSVCMYVCVRAGGAGATDGVHASESACAGRRAAAAPPRVGRAARLEGRSHSVQGTCAHVPSRIHHPTPNPQPPTYRHLSERHVGRLPESRPSLSFTVSLYAGV